MQYELRKGLNRCPFKGDMILLFIVEKFSLIINQRQVSNSTNSMNKKSLWYIWENQAEGKQKPSLAVTKLSRVISFFTKILIALEDFRTIYTVNHSRVNLGGQIHSSLGQLQTDTRRKPKWNYIKCLNLK